MELSEVRVPELMRELSAETRELQAKPGIVFTWNVPAHMPPVRTDPVKLKVIVKNLLENAVKFTEAGTVTVTVASRDGGIEIAVADTGIGMRPDALPLIFDSFRQLESSLTRRYGGVGLGLYIVRRLLELLGGTIAVESEVGKGTAFRVWLPRGPKLGAKT